MLKASVCGTNICYQSYEFNSGFSGSASNKLNGFIFKKSTSLGYMVGAVNNIAGNLGRTFSKLVGFVMEIDYLSSAT